MLIIQMKIHKYLALNKLAMCWVGSRTAPTFVTKKSLEQSKNIMKFEQVYGTVMCQAHGSAHLQLKW